MASLTPERRTDFWARFTLSELFYWVTVFAAATAFYSEWGLFGLAIAVLLFPTAVGLFVHYSRRNWSVRWPVMQVLSIVIAGFLFACCPLGPTAERSSCLNNLKQIGIAIHNHHDQMRGFPARAYVHPTLKAGMSWRVGILPFLYSPSLYPQFDFTEPWDGPTNAPLSKIAPFPYNCPSDPTLPVSNTNYLAVGGNDTFWPNDEILDIAAIESADGLSNTVMIVERHATDVVWSEPRDLDAATMSYQIGDENSPSLSSGHANRSAAYLDGTRRNFGRAGANVLMADASSRYLSPNTDPEVLKQLVNRRDGKPSKLPD